MDADFRVVRRVNHCPAVFTNTRSFKSHVHRNTGTAMSSGEKRQAAVTAKQLTTLANNFARKEGFMMTMNHQPP